MLCLLAKANHGISLLRTLELVKWFGESMVLAVGMGLTSATAGLCHYAINLALREKSVFSLHYCLRSYGERVAQKHHGTFVKCIFIPGKCCSCCDCLPVGHWTLQVSGPVMFCRFINWGTISVRSE